MKDYLGYFRLHGSSDFAIIAVSDSLDKTALIDTLCEEWAHARTAHLQDRGTLCLSAGAAEDPHHHPTFWAEYGRIQLACRSVKF